ncbi:MAG: hypothetical protein ACRDHZ_10595 [Ktedonobacteraceae bacterium]
MQAHQRISAAAPASIGTDLPNTAYAVGSAAIDLPLSLVPWAPLRSDKAAVGMDMLLNTCCSIPRPIHNCNSELHHVSILDPLIPEAGEPDVLDCGIIEPAGLYRLHWASSFFVLPCEDPSSDQFEKSLADTLLS